MTAYTIRRLGAADLAAYRPMRLEALQRHPEAFGSSFEEEVGLPTAELVRMFLPAEPPNGAFGAFTDGGQLAGIAGLFVSPKVKQRHIGTMIAVYVDPAHRRMGLARRIGEAVMAEARRIGLMVLELTVTVGNDSARRLYVDLGFTPYGIHRRALKIGDATYDVELMAQDLQ